MDKHITLGISGASGIPIAFSLLKALLASQCLVHLVVTNAGIVTAKQEAGISLAANPNSTKAILVQELELANSDRLLVYTNNDWYAPIASGSSTSEAMIVCPCSMATLGKLANGIGDDLLSRAADVVIKERKNLVIVPRETPLSVIHLSNMQKLAALGVSILPPVPAFYTHPQTVQDIIDFIVSRILDQVGVANNLVARWGDSK
jgi:4-hydroxy-3-polyprenylbenzoate decarboxylase